MSITNRLLALYATELYLPASGLARHYRALSRHLRGKRNGARARTRLRVAPWWRCVPRRSACLFEPRAENGNVRLSELGILSRFAADCEPGTVLFEIGTFDGRTTLNLAMNAPSTCRVVTLDLPAEAPTHFKVAPSERKYINKSRSGSHISRYRGQYPQLTTKVEQLLGDSASYDCSPYFGSCSLVFVDGSHAYDYVRSDTLVARRLVMPGGVIIWHDYGVWSGVTRALEEFEDQESRGLLHIANTSLVCWRSPVPRLDAVPPVLTSPPTVPPQRHPRFRRPA